MSNIAADIIIPNDADVFRSVFLYVGQGDCTLHVVPDGNGGRKFVMVDINLDRKRGGTDVIRVLEDILPRDDDGKPTLDLFINTHPHNDHICGLEEVNKRIRVMEVWHTGFEPSNVHEGNFRHLIELIDMVREREGDDGVFEYQGTRKDIDIGAVDAHVVAPAKHVKDEIDELEDEERDRRIHEYCGVIRLGYGDDTKRKHVLHTGDSDRCAWENHILGEDDYHADRLPSAVVNASHHGSRSFFKDSEEGDPYEHHIETIDPTWVVISSPEQSKSPHGHPHDDAVALYEKHVGDRPENVITLGKSKAAQIYDVYPNGDHVMDNDSGELSAEYDLTDQEGGEDGGRSNNERNAASIAAPAVITRIDHSRPMGA
ncbi:MAG: ComEC/Rec2 family competence protein [Gemmatimonadaceae bacterium]